MYIESGLNLGKAIPTVIGQPAGLASLFARAQGEHFAAGQILFMEGDEVKSLFEIVEGTLRIYRILGDGRRVITGFVHAGDILGLSFQSHHTCSAEAITPVTIRRLSRKAFEAELMDCAELRPLVFQHMSTEMAEAQDQMVLLSTKNAEERLCTFLLKELQRAMRNAAVQPVVQLPMTRLDIADHLGLTIETVSRTMTKLCSKGVTAVCGRHAVKILKRAMLAHLAGDGDEYAQERRSSSATAGLRH